MKLPTLSTLALVAALCSAALAANAPANNCGGVAPTDKPAAAKHKSSHKRKHSVQRHASKPVAPIVVAAVPQPVQQFTAPTLPVLVSMPTLPPSKEPRVIAPLVPRISNPGVNENIVNEVYLRPLFVTTIRVPGAVTSIAVGAPTLFAAEHSDDDERLVFVKPTTHEKAESNLLVALHSGEVISMKLISVGDNGTAPTTDYVVDYRAPKSLLNFGSGASEAVAAAGTLSQTGDALEGGTPSILTEDSAPRPLDEVLKRQQLVAQPVWVTASDLARLVKANEYAPNTLAVSIGSVVQNGDVMTVTYSMLNVGKQWIQVLPPQLQLANPAYQSNPTKKGNLAEQVPSLEFRLTATKLAPGTRADGAVQFSRPGFKQSKEALLLQIATVSAVDKPLLLPLPFVAAGQ